MKTAKDDPILLSSTGMEINLKEYEVLLNNLKIQYEKRVYGARPSFLIKRHGIPYSDIPYLSFGGPIQNYLSVGIDTTFESDNSPRSQTISVDSMRLDSWPTAGYEILEPFLEDSLWEKVKQKSETGQDPKSTLDMRDLKIMLLNKTKGIILLYNQGISINFIKAERLNSAINNVDWWYHWGREEYF